MKRVHHNEHDENTTAATLVVFVVLPSCPL